MSSIDIFKTLKMMKKYFQKNDFFLKNKGEKRGYFKNEKRCNS